MRNLNALTEPGHLWQWLPGNNSLKLSRVALGNIDSCDWLREAGWLHDHEWLSWRLGSAHQSCERVKVHVTLIHNTA